MSLFVLAQQYNRSDANILEIGTALGFSASIMAQAAPLAKIVTLEPKPAEFDLSCRNLAQYKNVKVFKVYSWKYLAEYTGPELDMIFVDGDHKRVGRDLPWFNWLKIGGLILFHDYSSIACPPVYNTINKISALINRPLDIQIIDTNLIGMAGIYRQRDEVL